MPENTHATTSLFEDSAVADLMAAAVCRQKRRPPMTVADVAEDLGVSGDFVLRLIESGQLPALRMMSSRRGRRPTYRILPEHFAVYLSTSSTVAGRRLIERLEEGWQALPRSLQERLMANVEVGQR